MKILSRYLTVGSFVALTISSVALAQSGFSGKGPAGCTDRRCWQAAVNTSVAACRASGCKDCSVSASASDNCKFENGYTCNSVCKSAAPATPAPAAPAPAAPASSGPGDVCAPVIGNNAGAAGVCGPVCEKAGLVFGGNWSNDANHPPVKACAAAHTGSSVCGCAAKPGDRCAGVIANNSAAAGVCGPVCSKEKLAFGGNWSNDANHPPVKACVADHKGSSVCGCK